MRSELGAKAKFALLIGRPGWVEDGRCQVPVPTMLVNFVFQRIFRLNSGCRFPVHFTSAVVAPHNLTLGQGAARSLATSGGVYLKAITGVLIGDDCLIAPGVKIVSANHSGTAPSGWIDQPPISVGARCWIAANAVILPGITIGDDSVIAAGAVVKEDVPAGHLAIGVPARVLPRSSESVEYSPVSTEDRQADAS